MLVLLLFITWPEVWTTWGMISLHNESLVMQISWLCPYCSHTLFYHPLQPCTYLLILTSVAFPPGSHSWSYKLPSVKKSLPQLWLTCTLFPLQTPKSTSYISLILLFHSFYDEKIDLWKRRKENYTRQKVFLICLSLWCLVNSQYYCETLYISGKIVSI